MVLILAVVVGALLLGDVLRELLVGAEIVLDPMFSLALVVSSEYGLDLHREPDLTRKEGRLPWPVLDPLVHFLEALLLKSQEEVVLNGLHHGELEAAQPGVGVQALGQHLLYEGH